MKKFIMLNFMGILFAFSFFIHTEIRVNYYRISEILEYSPNEVAVISNSLISALYICVFVLVGIIIKREFLNSKLKYLSSLLWIPYYLILIYSFSLMFPLDNPALKPLPAVGLIILFLNLIYPLVIIIFALMFDLIKLFKKS